jgi:protein SCO1/2
VRGALLLGVLLGCVAAAAIFVFADEPEDDRPVAIAPGPSGPFRGGRLPETLAGRPAPRIRLPDARGGILDTRRLRGKPYAVTFLYTNCRDVCPLIAQELGQTLRMLGPDTDARAVAVSVDPTGDTRGAVRRWLRRHRLPVSFRYLIGTRRQLAPVWKAYYAAPQPAEEPESRHTASIWLVDRAGRLRTKFSGGAPVAPRDLAHDFRLRLRR